MSASEPNEPSDEQAAPPQLTELEPEPKKPLSFVEANTAYFERIRQRKNTILRQHYRSGRLKKPSRVKGGKISKASILLVIVAVMLASTWAYAQYQGQLTISSTIRVPLYFPAGTQFSIGDIWLNKTKQSYIIDSAFTTNTASKLITFTFQAYGTIRYGNGTTTQDMTQVFSELQLVFNNYSQNMTQTSLLAPGTPVTFTFQNSSDQPWRLILTYSTKNVVLGGTAASLVINMLYTYNG